MGWTAKARVLLAVPFFRCRLDQDGGVLDHEPRLVRREPALLNLFEPVLMNNQLTR